MIGIVPIKAPLIHGRVNYADYFAHKYDHWGEVEIVKLVGGPYDGKEALVYQGWRTVGWEREYIRDPSNPSTWNYHFDTFL